MDEPREPPRHRQPRERLERQLGLFDVYAISTGAMFSSGFFLLPGLASAEAGPAVAVAYLLAGILIVPAMLSAAELSTAMPRAGGPYYFLDRAMGPLFGTVAGAGAWLALVFKSAFALVGMSAYIGIFVEMPIQPVAIGLTVAFTGLNVLGAKKTSGLQIALVSIVLAALGYFLATGLLHMVGTDLTATVRGQFTPFLPFGVEGVVATAGLVFVSFAGLTQVPSVSEEVVQPSRNIPLGMILSLLTALAVYVIGVLLMVAVLDPVALRDDLTPVASAAQVFMPTQFGLIAVVTAAVAAFSSTGNSGILSAARYPLAMSRDGLVWERLAKVGRFRTPAHAIVATGGVMIVCILLFDVRAIAGLASALMLLIFGLMNLAVIVMRESRIAAYDPGFRSPLYPWMQLAGIAVTGVLIIEIGVLSAVFTGSVMVLSLLWYRVYGRRRVDRDGAIYHIFERLGRRRDRGLDEELVGILSEEGVREEDRFEEVVARAVVIDLPQGSSYEDAVRLAAGRLGDRLATDPGALQERFADRAALEGAPESRGTVMPYVLLSDIPHPELVLVRAQSGVVVGDPRVSGGPAYALFFVVGDKSRAGQTLRILAQLAAQVDDDAFLRTWNIVRDDQELKEILLADERYLSLQLTEGSATETLIGSALRDVALPQGALVALVRRDGRTLVPRGSTVLREHDRLTVIGDANGLREVQQSYGD